MGQYLAAFTHRVTLECELVGVVHEAVEDRIGERGVVDQFVSFVDGELASHQRGAHAVAVIEDLQQITAIFLGKTCGTEVVEYQQIGFWS